MRMQAVKALLKQIKACSPETPLLDHAVRTKFHVLAHLYVHASKIEPWQRE